MLCETDRQQEYFSNPENVLCSPVTVFNLWKKILAEPNCLNSDADSNIDADAKTLFKLLLKTNDLDLPNINKSIYLSKMFLSYYTDNPVAQFYRASKIFLKNDLLKPFIEKFEEKMGISIKEYVYILHLINVNYHNLSDRCDCFDKDFIELWKLNFENLFAIADINKTAFDIVMKNISFGFSEATEWAKNAFFDENDTSLFRDKPFLKISEKDYIPVSGRLSCDLLFLNLFYKIMDCNPGTEFLETFGKAFEQYVVSFAKELSCIAKGKFEIKEEFVFDKRNSLRSPDMLLISPEKKVIAFEIKSARLLETFNKTYTDKKAFLGSIDKVYVKPVAQAMTAINKMVESGKTEFDSSYNFLVCSVAMKSMPMIFANMPVKIGGTDISDSLFYMDIETFEILMRVSCELPSDYTPSDLLWNYNKYRKEMSLKTYLSRMEKRMGLYSKEIDKKIVEEQLEYCAFIKPKPEETVRRSVMPNNASHNVKRKNCVVPLFKNDVTKRKMFIGSSVYLNINEKKYLVTAEHVIHDDKDVLTMVDEDTMGNIPYQKDSAGNIHWSYSCNPLHDFAITQLESELREFEPLELSDIFDGSVDIASLDFIACGYPRAYVIEWMNGPDSRNLKTQPLACYTKMIADDSVYSAMGFTNQESIIVEFDKNNSYINGKKQQAPVPNGMSGGPFFCVKDNKAVLCGILTNWDENKQKYMRAVKIECVTQAINCLNRHHC